MNCEWLLPHDEELAARDAEIMELKSKLLAATGARPKVLSASTSGDAHVSRVCPGTSTSPSPRRGKAPPVDSFSGDSVKTEF